MNYSQQFLPVRGIVNARDLGGYVVKDGMVVKDRMLIRTAHLAGATDEDLQFLSGIPVTKIIDFRMETEKQGTVDRMIPCAEYVALPVDGSGNAAAEMTEEEKKKFTGQKKFEIKQFVVFAAFNEKAQKIALGMYPTLLFNPECQRQFARFFRQVLDTENGAVLYHCSQGKDRTGIASCLLLAALGADKETIVADFDATNKVYERDVKKYCRRVRLLGGKEDEIAVVKSILGCNTEIFVKTLDRIDREYGSMEAYLKGPMGLTDEDILILRQRYLERMP
jgi:protein-tyrosine phosphatase